LKSANHTEAVAGPCVRLPLPFKRSRAIGNLPGTAAVISNAEFGEIVRFSVRRLNGLSFDQ